MNDDQLTITLQDYLESHPLWTKRSGEKMKRRVGILLPVRSMEVETIRKACSENWVEPVLIGSEKDVTNFQTNFKNPGTTTVVGASWSDALQQAIETKAIDILLEIEHDVPALFKKLLSIPAYRTGWVSQVALVLPPRLEERLLLLSDAGITIKPTLEQHIKIVENVIGVARKLQFEPIKVALLTAVETVSADIPSGMHSAIIAKMGERGQFGNAQIEGPLALDLALSEEAAIKKKVKSPVAGHANILIAPNLEAGAGLYKAMTALAGSASASVVVGGCIPIALPSRVDNPAAIVSSILFAAMLS